MTELEERIIAFIVKETGVKRKRVQPDSSLAGDIGVDGDDAVEFFQRFGAKFHVDLTELHSRWNIHFYPEGFSVSPGCIIVMAAGIIAGDLIHVAFRRIPAWTAMTAFTAALGWVYNRFFIDADDEKMPITVRDLVDAAVSGKWGPTVTRR